MALSKELTQQLLSRVGEEVPLEAALLLRRTGTSLAAWTRANVQAEVVTVMAATMMGSIEAIAQAAGCPPPENVFVETDGCRLFALSLERQATLVLVASTAIAEQQLRTLASEIALRLFPASDDRSWEPIEAPLKRPLAP